MQHFADRSTHPACFDQWVGWVEPFAKPIVLQTTLGRLAEIFAVVRRVSGPIVGIESEFGHAMKRRIRPIPHSGYKPMLDRIDMNIVDVTRKIVFIANCVLPIAPLPDAAFALEGTTLGNALAARKRCGRRPT